MLILICGDRDWLNEASIRTEVERFDPAKDTILQGGARGADSIAYNVARSLGWQVGSWPTLSAGHVYTMRADWNRYGRAAGAIRNMAMLAKNPCLVMAFHADLSQSKGTAHMVGIAREKGVPVEVHMA